MKNIIISILVVLFFYVSAYGGTIIQITDDALDNRSPQVTPNGNIFWIAVDASDYYLKYYNGTTVDNLGGVQQIGVASVINYIDGNTAVYGKYDGNDWEIYYFDGVSEIQITNNSYDDNMPSISNGYIAWRADTAHDDKTDIFLYIPDPPPEPPCKADLDCDNEVGLFDLIIMKEEYSRNDCP